jgi:hypothetical protein
MKFLSLLSLWLVMMSLGAEEVPRPLLIQAERFTLPRAEAFDLLTGSLSDTALRQEMIRRVAAKSARLDQFLLLRTVNGGKVSLKQVDEFPYPTVFKGAEVPGELVLADKAGAAALEVVKTYIPKEEEEPEEAPSATAEPPAPLKPAVPAPPQHKVGIGLQTTPAPEKLTFRNLGDTVEITLRSAADSVLVQLATETIHYLGEQTYLGVAQPRFQAQKMELTSVGNIGQPILLGTCNQAVRSGVPQGQQLDEVSLQFITVSAPELPALAALREALGRSDPFAAPRGDKVEIMPSLSDVDFTSKTLRFQFDVISLPTASAHALVETRATEPALLTRLQEMVQAHTATVEASVAFRTKSRMQHRAGQVTPFKYADDFSVFHIPSSLTITDPKILDLLYLHGGGTAAESQQFAQEFITVSEPQHFVLRNVGSSVDLTALLLGDGLTMKTNIVSEIVRHVGDRRIVRDQKPVFETQRLDTTVLLQHKLPLLLGTMSRPRQTGAPGGNVDDVVSFAFLTGTVE